MERKIWLEDAIYAHIMNNPNKDSVDICSYFKLRVDITLESINQLIQDKKIFRKNICGFKYVYEIFNFDV